LVATGKYCAASIGGGWGLSCGNGGRGTKADLDAAADALPAGECRKAPNVAGNRLAEGKSG
jgi:hypothetical protein